MSELQSKNFDEPDEVLSGPGLSGKIVNVGGTYVGRYVHQPGWRWSKDIKPIVGTPYCQVHHQGIMLSGQMRITQRNGAERIIGPNEVFDIPPGHDGIVIGDEPCISIEFRGVRDWAKPAISGERTLTTILFTDIVGSTAMATRLGDSAWKNLLAKHYERVRLQLDLFRGYEIKTTGDGFLAIFDGTARALHCAKAISKVAREDGVEVRAGIHTGEIELHNDGAHGLGVHITARIMSLAGAGEVMVSGSTVAMLEGSDLSFNDLGEYELKGVEGRRRVFKVMNDDE